MNNKYNTIYNKYHNLLHLKNLGAWFILKDIYYYIFNIQGLEFINKDQIKLNKQIINKNDWAYLLIYIYIYIYINNN